MSNRKKTVQKTNTSKTTIKSKDTKSGQVRSQKTKHSDGTVSKYKSTPSGSKITYKEPGSKKKVIKR